MIRMNRLPTAIVRQGVQTPCSPRLGLFFLPNLRFATLKLAPLRTPSFAGLCIGSKPAINVFCHNSRAFSTNAAKRAAAANQIGINDIPQPSHLGTPKSRFVKPPRVVSARAVGVWLLVCGAAVFGIVVLGGLTRLTESGLSITEWKPLTGALPPMSQSDWENEFALYKDSPEFKELNSSMDLEEYKFIYYMEWAHRLWGRAIGLMVLAPGLYFALRGRTSPATNRSLLGISLLVGLQGVIGWWMVHSGIDTEHLDSRADRQPRVGHYRLATHLGTAFLLYFAMGLVGFGILKHNRYIRNPVKANQEIAVLSSALAVYPRRFAWGLLGLAFITSLSGAFVAGLDAGLLYNSFPLMGRGVVPSSKELLDKRYTLEPNPSTWTLVYKNLLDNPVTVQFGHRVLAMTTWAATALFFVYARRRRALLPRSVYMGAHGVFGFASMQAALGILTLIYVVPVPLAALHQSGALLLLTSILALINRLRVPSAQIRRIIRLLAEKARATKPSQA